MIDRHGPILYSADLHDCTQLSTLSPDHVAALFAWIVEDAGATVVRAVSHYFPVVGLTSVLILTESHAVLHTWPESGTVHIDIFSCSPRLKSLAAVAAIGEVLGAGTVAVQEVPRAAGHHRLAASPA